MWFKGTVCQGCHECGVTAIQGFQTMSMHCEFEDGDGASLLKSTYIRPVGTGNVQCVCEVTNPIENSPGHALLKTSLSYTCYLVIIRCPL